MEPRDDQGHDENQRPASPPESERANGNGGRAAGAQVIDTEDPVIAQGAALDTGPPGRPDGSTAIETSRIRGPNEAFNPNFVMVPVETDRPSQERPGAEEEGEDVKEEKKEKVEKKDGKDRGRGGKGDRSDSSEDRDDDRDRSDDRDKDRHDRPAQGPSLTRILLLSGVVALVCGVVGAWGYSALFGSGKKSDDKKSSSKDSGSGKDSDSGSDSGSDSDSGKDTGSDARKNSTSKDKGELRQAEAAWMVAVKELHKAQEDADAARRSEEETKAILDFLKNTLLSAGRPGDVSLTDAFWAGGKGKDVPLRKAVDAAEARVAEAFADRPRAEASVREMLGSAYLGLGEPAQAVKEYERALALREAEGVGSAETAACRNQLAVAYRLAVRTNDAGRLFDQKPESTAHASALAVRAATLLAEKKPAEAELKLRECLAIRRKLEPDDWSTFDATSTLGEALLDQKKSADAEPLLVSGYEGMRQREDAIPSRDRPRLARALERLVRLYEAWGKNGEASRWRMELEAVKALKQT